MVLVLKRNRHASLILLISKLFALRANRNYCGVKQTHGSNYNPIHFFKILLLKRNIQWKFHRNQLTGNHCVCSANKTYSCIIHSLTVPLNIFLIFLTIAISKIHIYCIFCFQWQVKTCINSKTLLSVKTTALLGRQTTPLARSSCVFKALLSHVADGLENRVNNSINTRQIKCE